jgi:hypothetical protein
MSNPSARAVVLIDNLTCLVRFRVDGLSIERSVADLQDSVQNWDGLGKSRQAAGLGQLYGTIKGREYW